MFQEMTIVSHLKKIPLYEREQVLTRYLKEICVPYLHITVEEFPSDVSLFELGLTSLSAVEIKSVLENDLKVKLCSTILFDYPTIAKLSQFIQDHKLATFFGKISENIENDLACDFDILGKEILNRRFNLKIRNEEGK